jgi:hypothetical protein
MGDPAMVVTSCATGSDMAIDDGGTAIVMVRAWSTDPDGRSMLTTGAWFGGCWGPWPGCPAWPLESPVAALRLSLSWAFCSSKKLLVVPSSET